MGDRTFTGNDVLRIYEFFLDSDEQEQVENFFREMSEGEEPEETGPTTADFRRLLGLFRQLSGPARIVANFASRFTFLVAAVSVVQFVLEQLDIFLDDLLDRGVIDA